MLEEKPLQMQFNEKKEIEELSTSYNDTQARSQSLKPKIILDSSNSQEFIKNLNILSNIKNKIEAKEFLSSLLNDLPFSECDITDGKHFLSIFHLYVIIIFRS